MNIPPPYEQWLDNLGFTMIAALAGLLGHIMRNSNSRRKTTWGRCALEAASSGFIGFLTIMLCKAMGMSYEWTGFLVGVLGWLGAAASIQIFERVARKKLGIQDEDTNVPPPAN